MKHTFVALLSLSTTGSFAQNLVPNANFETTDGTFCGIPGPGDYTAIMQHWYSPSDGSPDVFFTNNDPSCWNFQPNSTYSGPIGLKGSQLPRSGSVMSAIFLLTIPGLQQRDYLQIQLDEPLVIGNRYVVECYVSLADSTEFGTNRLGMLLSTDPVSSPFNGVLAGSPQVETDEAIMDYTNWVRVFDTLYATEAYTYLTIGNFYNDAQTPLTANPHSSGQVGAYGAYYYVDDVRIERVEPSSSVGLPELQHPDKKLLRIVDLLGRETHFEPNTVLIYIYDDGTMERVMQLEK